MRKLNMEEHIKDQSYTPDLVRAVLRSWSQVDGIKEKSTAATFAVPYCLKNDSTALIMDVFGALETCLDKRAQTRLSLHYLFGYTHEEVGLMEGLSASASKMNCTRAIEQIAEYLETPKGPATYYTNPDYEQTHKTSYRSFPRH